MKRCLLLLSIFSCVAFFTINDSEARTFRTVTSVTQSNGSAGHTMTRTRIVERQPRVVVVRASRPVGSCR